MPLPDFSVWNYSRRFGSVEMKVAAALADKEGCAAKRKLAIEQEAERKRLKMMEKQKIGKEIAVTADSPQLPSLDGPFEEKYVGPLLNGAVPEMIVSSGSLGMTDTRPKQQIIRQRKRPSEKEALLEDPDWAFDDSSQPSTSSSHQKKLKSMNATSQLSQEPDDYTPNPGAHWESFGSSISSEKDLRRYREIGRIISEITLSDFPSDKGDRKARSISSRGEEILAAVKRNLNVVREKLESFAQATPQRVDRLSQMVAEKLQRNKMGEDPQPFHLAPDASITEKEVKLEEVEVKLEEPEYTDNCNF
ncbi:hypothetical protein L5515_010883 [Caenorhabditis briggsae]|uniref:Uncharacterized protein n=1 Tax=Caenorhabditis briggsae TaxID=6238 RepID=A0AAE9ESK0_CAEBR|nr:hypothetical protein L5515_010883 [Caenorhabditis briggsae]